MTITLHLSAGEFELCLACANASANVFFERASFENNTDRARDIATSQAFSNLNARLVRKGREAIETRSAQDVELENAEAAFLLSAVATTKAFHDGMARAYRLTLNRKMDTHHMNIAWAVNAFHKKIEQEIATALKRGA